MKNWWKLHACIDINTQTFLSWEMTEANVHDAHLLPVLLDAIEFGLGDVCADAAYLSSKNCLAVADHGGTPFFRPKSTTKGRELRRRNRKDRMSRAYLDMVDSYNADPRAWMARYGHRNNVESAFGGLKRCFRGTVRASNRRMHRIETALKILCWNITRRIHHEF